MGKNNSWIFWVAGGLILFLVLTQTSLLKKQDFGIGVHYYNDGIEVFPTKFFGFSIVTPPGGNYNQISFSISASSSDKSYSNIKVDSATPIQLFNALPTTTQTLASGQSNKILWTSSLINTSQFESMTQPVRFIVNISAKDDYTGLIEYKQGYVDLTIRSIIFTRQENGNQILCSGSWDSSYPCSRVYDSNWNTYGKVLSGEATFFINYTIPDNTTSIIWQFKFGAGTATDWRNRTIGEGYGIDNCWAYAKSTPDKKLQFKMVSYGSSNTWCPGTVCANFFCWDGSYWNQQLYLGNRNEIYEDAIWWGK